MTAYIHTDQRLHLMCQLIAKVNVAYVPKREDDSHTNLSFDAIGQKVYGHWFKHNDQLYISALNLNNLHYELLSDKQIVIYTLNPVGKSWEEVEHSLKDTLTSLGLDPNAWPKNLHYELPQYTFSDQIIAKLDKAQLEEWMHFRSIANDACLSLSLLAQIPQKIRIWPHHFDTGIYIEPNNQVGFGFGLAMEDNYLNTPYFYLSAYTKNQHINYDQMPESDEWTWIIQPNWKACLLPLDQIQKKSGEQQQLLIARYLKTVYRWWIKQ